MGERKIIGIGREAIGRRKDGTTFPIHLSVSELNLGDHRLFTGLVRDITERKRAKEALRETELRWRTFLERVHLIVDDESSFTRNVKLNLEQTGKYEVAEVNHSSQALAVADAFKPDLILLDVMMPVLDGGDVLACLKADPFLKDVPVLVVTAAAKKQEVDTFGGVIGGYPFLAKPIPFKALLEHIEKRLAPSPNQ